MHIPSSIVRTIVPEHLSARVRILGDRYGVRDIRVFGSLGHREAGPNSDIDLPVDYVPGHGGFAFVEFCDAVEKLLGRRVDVVTERPLRPRIRERGHAQALPI
jgi:hypothetical protein